MPVFDRLKSLYKRLPWMFKPGFIPGFSKTPWIDDLRAMNIPLQLEHEVIVAAWEKRFNKIDAKLVKLKEKNLKHNQKDLFKDVDGARKLSDGDKLQIEVLEKEKKNIEDAVVVLIEHMRNNVNEEL